MSSMWKLSMFCGLSHVNIVYANLATRVKRVGGSIIQNTHNYQTLHSLKVVWQVVAG
jgi:hypothetical protein